MPFRYGIAEMTAVPHLILRLDCDIDGGRSYGFSAENLIPKWFTKDPNSSYEDELADMFAVIEHAADAVNNLGERETIFDLWHNLYEYQEKWADAVGYPSLLWNLGVSLIERALFDAHCRIKGIPFAAALESNQFGVRLETIHPELAGLDLEKLLATSPLASILVRHTVGLSDYLLDDDIPERERVEDGLPQSLESNIRTYQLRYFKIKVNGDLDRDLHRLCRIKSVLDKEGCEYYWFTLDGNEQFVSVSDFQEFWSKLTEPGACTLSLDRLLFVEQPFHRMTALSQGTALDLASWKDRPPIIIDESDSEIGSMKLGLKIGYSGTSHKNCKGIFKSIANACLLEFLRGKHPDRSYFLSGEDLANIGPVSLMQDLAVMSILGIPHVERNGHQYFLGLKGFPQDIQCRVAETYPDLYKQKDGLVTLAIAGGKISLDGVNRIGFGGFDIAAPGEYFQERKNWKFESLDIHL
jgi:hypothetical protein